MGKNGPAVNENIKECNQINGVAQYRFKGQVNGGKAKTADRQVERSIAYNDSSSFRESGWFWRAVGRFITEICIFSATLVTAVVMNLEPDTTTSTEYGNTRYGPTSEELGPRHNGGPRYEYIGHAHGTSDRCPTNLAVGPHPQRGPRLWEDDRCPAHSVCGPDGCIIPVGPRQQGYVLKVGGCEARKKYNGCSLHGAGFV